MIRVHRFCIHGSIAAVRLTAVVAYGIKKIHSPYKITKTRSTVEACSLSAATALFISKRCGRRAGSQWGILHGHVIWALCLDTAHEGQAYLWRARRETATGKRGRHWIDLLWKLQVFIDAFTPRCSKVIKPNSVAMQNALASWIHGMYFCNTVSSWCACFGGTEMRCYLLLLMAGNPIFTKCVLSSVNARFYLL